LFHYAISYIAYLNLSIKGEDLTMPFDETRIDYSTFTNPAPDGTFDLLLAGFRYEPAD
jgi:hypothetical protein